MQLTAVLLLTACLQVAANTSGQTVTLKVKDAPLKQVLVEIQEQTGFSILFDNQLVERAGPVTLNVRDMPINEVMNICLKDQPFQFTVANNSIVIKSHGMELKSTPTFFGGPPEPIRGVVRDSTGAALSGATVYNKRTKKSVQTNARGEFSIEGDVNDELQITFIGFEQKTFTFKGGALLTVLNVSSSPLDEVQIQAYGTTSRRFSTGTISSVKSDQIEKQPVSNPLLALTSRVPGLEIVQSSGIPGSPVTVKIRGRNSLSTTGNDPLFVIDGLPYLGQTGELPFAGLSSDFQKISALSLINPNDIGSIEVLKDADATSIYGSRGANGVILISTKKGKAGTSRINLNVQSGIGQVARKAKLLNVEQYKKMRFEALSNSAINISDPAFDSAILQILYPDLFAWNGNHDWQQEMIGGTAKYNDFQASISGGSSSVQYLISGNFHKETTVFPSNSGDHKANVHLSLNTTSSNQKFRTSFIAGYMSNWRDYPKYDFTQFITLAPTAPNLLRSDGSLNWGLITHPVYGFSLYTLQNNPYANLFQPFTFNANNLVSNANISYSFLSNFVAKLSVGYNTIQGNSFSGRPSSAQYPGAPVNRTSYFNNNGTKSIIVEPQLSYNKLTGRNRIDALIGGSFQNRQTEIQFVNASGFASDELIKNLGAAAQYTNENSLAQYKYLAAFGRVTYNFLGKYLISLNGRRDGSSRFGPGKQFGNFGSVAAAWIFSEERFIKETIPFMSFGKVRVSYGTAGNDGIGDYKYLEKYQNTAFAYLETKGLVLNELVNKDFHWESIKKSEISLDLGFFKDQITFQGNYYRNRSSNQLQTLLLPNMTGAGQVIYNSPALIQNSGVEVVVNSINVDRRSFKWTTSFNITRQRNKLVAYPSIESSTIAKIHHYELGQPIGLPSVYKFIGVDPTSGNYQFSDVNGNPLGGNADASLYQRISVNTNPSFYSGLFNSISYKNITFDFLVQFVKQVGRNYLYNFPQSPGQFTSGGGILSNQPVDIIEARRWKKAGDISVIGKFQDELSTGYNEAVQSDAAYSDASYIRLKNISLSVDLTTRMIQRMRLQGLRIYLHGQNLVTVTNYRGLDPENQSVTSLPMMRVVTVGIQASL